MNKLCFACAGVMLSEELVLVSEQSGASVELKSNPWCQRNSEQQLGLEFYLAVHGRVGVRPCGAAGDLSVP